MADRITLGLLLGGVQTGLGLFQRRKAQREFENAEQPDYTQSDAFQTAESSANLAYRQAQEGLPEQVRRRQEDMIGRSGAAGLATTGSLRSGIAGVGQTAQSLTDAYRDLAAMDAQQQIANRGRFFQQQNLFQREQQRAFDYEMGDFINQQAARLGRMSAGQQTIDAGLSGLSSLFGQAIAGGGLTGNPGASGNPTPTTIGGQTPMRGSGYGLGQMGTNQAFNYGLQQGGFFPITG